MSKIAIIIPARYQSSRLPGKPLQLIAGVAMLQRVAHIAQRICRDNASCQYCVATDDARIMDFCSSNNINAVMTSADCASGTERCLAAVETQWQASKPELIINLQGDNPLCPPWIIQNMIDAWQTTAADVYTPCVVLSWRAYADLVIAKQTTPYSGTTVLVDNKGYALAFSKAIIPVIRKPERAQQVMPASPVRQHIGLYAYTYQALATHAQLEISSYEQDYIEGLEQMRFLYNGLKIKVVEVDYHGRPVASGVDSPADIVRAEAIIAAHGELLK